MDYNYPCSGDERCRCRMCHAEKQLSDIIKLLEKMNRRLNALQDMVR